MRAFQRYFFLFLLATSLLVFLAAPVVMAQPAGDPPVIDDFENGVPGTWFQYGDYGSGVFINPATVLTDTVPGLTANNVLAIEYNSAGWGAGTGNNLGGQDWSAYDGFAFWFKGAATGATFRVILSDNPDPNLPGDTAERFAYEFVDDSAGWRHVLIPWGAFFRDYAYQPGGAPDDGLTLTNVQAYALALPPGTAATIYIDDVRLVKFQTVDGFEDGVPATWFQYGDYGSGAFINTTVVPTDTVPAMDPNNVLQIEYNSAGWGAGTGNNLGGQDWSSYNGFGFWFWGSASNGTYRVILSDNLNPNVPGDSAERFAYEFTDNFNGWRFISIPWGAFFRDYAYQPGGAPDDGLTLTDVQAYALALPGGQRTTYLDHVVLFGDGQAPITVSFSQQALSVDEGGDAVLAVRLSAPAAGDVTVDVTTADGTATENVDYTPLTTTLTFPAGVTEQTVTIPTVDDSAQEADETFTVSLSNPQGAALGARSQATVTILDNDAPVLAGKSVLIDDFEVTTLPYGTDADGNGVGFVTWNHPAASAAVTVTTAPPAPVPDASDPNTVLQLDLSIGAGQWAGYTHAFTNDAADTWLSQDWSTYEGVSFWLYGNNTGGALFFDISENRNPGSTVDDTERWSVDIPDDFEGWRFFQIPFSDFHRKEIGNGAPNDGLSLTEVWGYSIGGYGSVDMGSHSYFVDNVALYGNVGGGEQPLTVAFGDTEITVLEGNSAVVSVTLSAPAPELVTVDYRTAESTAMPDKDFTPVSGTLSFDPGQTEATFSVDTFDNSKHDGNRALMLNLSHAVGADLGFARRAVVIIADDDPADAALIDDFEGWQPFETTGQVAASAVTLLDGSADARPGQDRYEGVLSVTYDATDEPATLTRSFAQPQDWSAYQGLRFWYYGSGNGDTVQVELHDNAAADTASTPAGDWVLAWSDEFDDPAGTPPNPNKWTPEIGDGTLYGIPGWGNGESQFYTGDPANASTDGQGNLVISLQPTAADDSRLCWYGPCEYTSARLISAQKNEFQYGRIEARVRVPDGPSGLWPAFWMLGTNIDEVGWPQSGEIDVMEYVSRIPNEIFGTIHGPGYSGGAGFGNAYQFPGPVASDYHTFAVEWAPDEIHWYVDGINYLNASPADVAPNEWVYNHPFYLILNLAIGGNFGGEIASDMTFPQNMLVDYVRVYQAADSAERFTARFVDDTAGWRQVEIPFTYFRRSAEQPAGAPDDGLTLSAVHGYGLRLPAGSAGMFMLDQVRLAETVAAPDWVASIRQSTQADPLIYGSTIAVDVNATNYSGAAAQPFLVVPLDSEVSYVPGSATNGAFPLTAGQMAAMGYTLGAQAQAGEVVAVAYNNPVADGEDVSFGFAVRVRATAGTVQHTLLSPAGAVSSNSLDITPTVMVELPLLADTWVSSGAPAANYNAYAALIARTTGVDNVLLTFDRSSLPAGAHVLLATLDVNVKLETGQAGKQLNVMNVVPFAADTVTYNDGLTTYNPGPAMPVALGALSLDATAQVAAWDSAGALASMQDGLGYLALAAAGPAGRVAFDSLESYNGQAPTLTVIYMP